MTERSQGVQDLIPKIPRDERCIKGCRTYVNSPNICCLSNEVDIFLLLSGSKYIIENEYNFKLTYTFVFRLFERVYKLFALDRTSLFCLRFAKIH